MEEDSHDTQQNGMKCHKIAVKLCKMLQAGVKCYETGAKWCRMLYNRAWVLGLK